MIPNEKTLKVSEMRSNMINQRITGGVVKLPESWAKNNSEVVSFRYEHPTKGEKNEEFYFKFYEAGSNLEVNAISSIHNDEIISSEFE